MATSTSWQATAPSFSSSSSVEEDDSRKSIVFSPQRGGLQQNEEDCHGMAVSSSSSTFDLRQEAQSLIHLTLPSVLVQLCLYVIFPLAASVVGREFGSVHLGGFSLGSLIGNLTCLSIIVGSLTAADTLMPRAYGSRNYQGLGILLIQSILVSSGLLVLPIIPLWTMTKPILIFLGQDPVASHLAADWIRVYIWGVPANLLFRAMQRFLVAQHQPWPPVFCAAVPCFVLQPIFLQVFTKRHGFLGSAWAIVGTQWSVTILLLLQTYCLPVHHPDSWPGSRSSFEQAVSLRHSSSTGTTSTNTTLTQFLRLSLGGVLSLSEWWFWETMCFIAGSFGVEALCDHTIAYNMIPLLYMIPLGFSIGLTVRMGHTLAANQIQVAKLIATWCMDFILLLAVAVSMGLWRFRFWIIGLFLRPEDHLLVLETTLQIWPYVCVYILVLYLFGINGAILKGLGMQWRLAMTVFGCLWCGLLPSVIYFAIVRGGGLIAQWRLLPAFYVAMQACLIFSYATVDWKHLVRLSMSTRSTADHTRSSQRASSNSLLVASSSRSLADVGVVVVIDALMMAGGDDSLENNIVGEDDKGVGRRVPMPNESTPLVAT